MINDLTKVSYPKKDLPKEDKSQDRQVERGGKIQMETQQNNHQNMQD